MSRRSLLQLTLMTSERSESTASSLDPDVSILIPYHAIREVDLFRSTLFYLGGILSSGLIVPFNHPDLGIDDGTARRSPFVIAFKIAGWTTVSNDHEAEHSCGADCDMVLG